MSKEFYQIMFEKSNMPMSILEEGVFIKCNQALLDSLNLKSFDEILGKHPFELSPEFQPDGKSSIDKSKQYLDEACNQVKEFEWLHKDGNNQERWFKIMLSPVPVNDKKGIVFAVWRDITEKKKTQEELTKQTEITDMFFSLTADLIDITDTKGRFTMVNKAWEETLGYTGEELAKLTYQDLVHPDDLEGFEKAQQRLERFEQVRDYVVRLRHKNGTYRYVEWRSIRKGDLYYGADWDVTDKVVAEEKLRVSEAKLQNLFLNMEEGVALHKMVFDDKGDAADYWIIDVNPAFYRHIGMKDKIKEKVLASQFYHLEKAPFLKEYEKVVKSEKATTFTVFYKPLDKHFKISAFCPQKGYFATVFSDVTQQKKYEHIIYSEKERLKTTLQSIGDGVITTDAHGNISLMNPVAESLTGWKQKDATGKPLAEVFHIINERTRLRCTNPVEKVLKEGKTVELANHTAIISKSGVERVIADTAAPIRDEKGKILGVVLVFRDVDEEKKREKEIIFMSFHDMLTGLHNRTYFEQELKKLNKDGELPSSIIIGDVNGLKFTNDIFGHSEGDRVLKRISKILKNACSSNDILARWGGDEFIILLPGQDEKQAEQICSRIKEECQRRSDNTIKTSISLGQATRHNHQEDFKHIIKAAEEMMYRHKLLESRSFRSSVISSLKKSLFERSNETEEHAERMAGLCVEIGRSMGLTENELDDLSLLSMLHDIGKIAISDSILLKPGPLSEREWIEMRKHSEIGYRIAQATPELAQYAEYILSHHERWDGTGYPQGLKEKEIGLFSRIIAIADAYDVMTNERVYSKAMTHEEAIEEIKSCSGTQFDPEIAEKFLQLYDKPRNSDEEEQNDVTDKTSK